MQKFEDLGLGPIILKTVSTLGFEEATPIQQKAIPIVLNGHDLMGLAQTGTGKTAAFGLPLIQNLLDEKKRPDPKSCRALILAPTRELVGQITDNLRSYVKGTKLRVQMVTGGVSIRSQFRKLAPGTDILVATPGRLLDLIDRGALTLDQTNQLVLDEADQMLDLGFIHSLRKIATLLSPERQTLLFSATMPKQIEELSQTYLKDPLRVETVPAGRPADKIKQSVHFVSSGGKLDLLKDCLAERSDDVSVIFARTKHGAEKLMKHLVACGYKAGSVHGNKTQSQRDRAIKAFRNGDISILVATDVAARGIDIPGVTHVYNYNLPEVPENYVHRIGRTGRAGAEGEAIAFCAPEELHLLKAIEKLIEIDLEVASGERPRPSKSKPRSNINNKSRRKRPGRPRHQNKTSSETVEAMAQKPSKAQQNQNHSEATDRQKTHKGNRSKSTAKENAQGKKKPHKHWSKTKNNNKNKSFKQKAANQNNRKNNRLAS